MKMNFEEFNPKKYPDNLVKAEWQEELKGYESVFHSTKRENLEKIAQEGIKPYKERNDEEKTENEKTKAEQIRQELREITDKIIDSFAEECGFNYTRKESFYASPEPEGNWHGADTTLELKIDPQTRVFESDYVTGAGFAWFRTEEGKEWFKNHIEEMDELIGTEERERLERSLEYYPKSQEEYARKYWEESISLEEYRQYSEEQKKQKFNSPEILIPQGIEPESIRIKEE